MGGVLWLHTNVQNGLELLVIYIHFFLAFASASSVATWAFWKQHHYIWASIVGIAQVLLIAKPYLPFIKNEKDYLEMSFEFDYLYLQYEKLWFCFEYKKKDNEIIEQTFYKFRDKELEIEKSHRNVHCPKINFIIKKAYKEVLNHSKINFSIGG